MPGHAPAAPLRGAHTRVARARRHVLCPPPLARARAARPPTRAQYAGLSGYGLSIAERVPCVTSVNEENVSYLRTKQQKMGHWLPTDFDALLDGGGDVPGAGTAAADVVAEAEAAAEPEAQLAAMRAQLAEACKELDQLRALAEGAEAAAGADGTLPIARDALRGREANGQRGAGA